MMNYLPSDALLKKAVIEGDFELAERLLKETNDPNDESDFKNVLLVYAINNNNEAMIEVFLKNGATLKQRPEIFYSVIRKQNVNVIKSFLQYDKGLDINSTDRSGETPLLRLIQTKLEKHHELLIKFLERGADVNYQQPLSGNTALHFAFMLDEEMVKTLLEANADVNVKNMMGETALCNAARFGVEKICLLLLQAQLANKSNEQAALRIACFANRPKTISVLLNYGVDKFDVDVKYVTLVKRSKSNESVVGALEEHIVKLAVANLQLHEADLAYFNSDLKNRVELIAACQLELKALKSAPTSDVSFYDILTAKPDKACNLLRNEETWCDLDRFDCTQFPIYGQLIDNRIKRSRPRAQLLNGASNCLNAISGGRFPYPVIECILGYLSDVDMKQLISVLATLFKL